jgi:hypothetical protein
MRGGRLIHRRYYYSWFYTYDYYIQESTVDSTIIYKTTTLSVSTTDSEAASDWFSSVTEATSFLTPAAATTLPPLPSQTPTVSNKLSGGGDSPAETSVTTTAPAFRATNVARRPVVGEFKYGGGASGGLTMVLVGLFLAVPGVLMIWL